MRRKPFITVALVSSVLAIASAPALADPGNSGTRTITLYNCTGPAGTPTTFTIVKESGIVTAFHLVDGTGLFIPVGLADLTAGQQLTVLPGFDVNNVPLVTCNITRPRDGELFLIAGFFTPVGQSAAGSDPDVVDTVVRS